METNKPLLLSAILESKNAIVILRLFPTDRWLDIEVERDMKGENRETRSHYSLQIYVADKKFVKSTKSKPNSSVLKWEWNEDERMWVLVL